MAPEYGATCGFFPVDADDASTTCSSPAAIREQVALVEAYAKEQGLWRDEDTPDPVFTDTLELDLGTVVSSLAGPKRPQDRVPLSQRRERLQRHSLREGAQGRRAARQVAVPTAATTSSTDGAVVIAAITSCTNTSNPSVLIGAGLLAQKAVEQGLT